jgi:cardiolipin synthase A/B
VLSSRSKVRRISHPEGERVRRRRRLRDGSSGRAATSAVRWANSVGAALTSRRELGPAESHLMLGAGIMLTVVAAVAILWPRVLTIPIAVLAAWVGLASLLRAWRLARERLAGQAPPVVLGGATEPVPERLP